MDKTALEYSPYDAIAYERVSKHGKNCVILSYRTADGERHSIMLRGLIVVGPDKTNVHSW